MAEEQETNGPAHSENHRMPPLIPATTSDVPSIAHSGVSSAEVYPHPYRSKMSSIPLQLRHPVPLFEKSNVLVMCVLTSFFIGSSNQLGTSYPEAQLAQVCFCESQLPWTLPISLSGKTLLARTLAKVLDVPFSVNDATSFTQVSETLHLVVDDQLIYPLNRLVVSSRCACFCQMNVK
jgi:hypothetical protein